MPNYYLVSETYGLKSKGSLYLHYFTRYIIFNKCSNRDGGHFFLILLKLLKGGGSVPIWIALCGCLNNQKREKLYQTKQGIPSTWLPDVPLSTVIDHQHLTSYFTRETVLWVLWPFVGVSR